MHRRLELRRLLVLVLLVSASAAHAQAPPPPPPPLTALPPPPVPPGNPITVAKANLGKALFWDEQLSSTRTMACGSCHRAQAGGSDPRSGLLAAHPINPGADGVFGTPDDVTGSPGVELNQSDGALAFSSVYGLGTQVTGRLAPSNINAAYAPLLFWDGRASNTFADPLSGATVLQNGGALESQCSAPPVSSTEMAHLGRNWSDVAARVATSQPLALASGIPPALVLWMNDRSYPELFAEAFGTSDVTPARIALAIATYERTLYSTQTPFDSLIAGDTVLRPQEQAGFALFGQLNCARCHGGALTSDNAFHYTGVRPAAEDSGRMIVTHQPQDLGAMRTPILRNVALRPAFMHDGRFKTLDEVVAFYDRGGDFNAPNKDPLIRPLGLNAQQRAALVAFLGRPLTDPRVAAATAPFDRPTLYTETALVPQILAGGVAGGTGLPPQPTALEPALIGNPTFTVGVFGSLGGAAAVLVVDDSEPPLGAIPTSGTFARLATILQGSGTGAGWGSATFAIPNDAALEGRTLYGRWYVSDPAAAGGVAISPAFRFRIFAAHGETDPALTGVPPAANVGTARLYASYPNPFSASTTVRFDLLESSRVKLAVYDMAGRVTRRLDERAFATPGSYLVAWDGRGDDGRAAPPGVYFYRLETDRGVQTARVVRVR